jgi:uncharacterized protein YecE (DUF72 family)
MIPGERPPGPDLRIGTSSWTAPSWAGTFYPEGAQSTEYLTHYARSFSTVEIDATWYRPPSARTVESWNVRTPPGFIFSAKAPQTITHEKVLEDSERDIDDFLSNMERLDGKLGPVLLQFPYFRASHFQRVEHFLDRLRPFLDRLPGSDRIAVEVRNRGWLGPPLLEALRERNVALALIDHPWMPRAAAYGKIPGIVTADFLYIRWLGDRHGIEAETTRWDRIIVDRSREMQAWVATLRDLTQRVGRTYGYFNNHYAGCAYQSAQLFLRLWEECLLAE